MLRADNPKQEGQELHCCDWLNAVYAFLSLFILYKEALVDVAREVDTRAVDDDRELAEVLQAPEPAADSV